MLKVKKMRLGSKYHNFIIIVIIVIILSVLIILDISFFMKQENREDGSSVGIPDPSAVYCEKLGYKYIIENLPGGGQRGVCIFNSEKCDTWDFFEGKCGLEYTFCAKHGGIIKVIQGERCKFTYTCILCKIGNKECTEWEWVAGLCS